MPSCAYIDDQLRVPTDYISGIPWQERERLFDEGDIQILWLCGLPYVQKADGSGNALELLAVPVPSGARYSPGPFISPTWSFGAIVLIERSSISVAQRGLTTSLDPTPATTWCALILPSSAKGRGFLARLSKAVRIARRSKWL